MGSHESDICVLCGIDTNDELMGPLLRKNALVVHHHCLFLTHGLLQNGKSSSGICGFYVRDIREAARKCQDYICFYCRLPKANVLCWNNKCSKRFHYSCGLKNDCKTRFEGYFETYCNTHAKWRFARKPRLDDVCNICTDPFGKQKPSECLLACCCKSGWFHKRCISKYANVSGYFFKCPLCQNIDRFRKGMVNNGVFVPNCDGFWEVENNVINDMLSEEKSCTAEECLCTNGRTYDNGAFKLISCCDCGSNHCHFACLVNNEEEYKCDVCKEISENIQKKHESDEYVQPSSANEEDISLQYSKRNNSTEDFSVCAKRRKI